MIVRPSHLAERAEREEEAQREGGRCREKGNLLLSLRESPGPFGRSSEGTCKFIIRKLEVPGSKMGCLEGR